MLDGSLLVDAHVHVPVLGSLAPAWVEWARDFGPDGILEDVWDADGVPRPARLDALFEEQGVDHALLFCEYSPEGDRLPALRGPAADRRAEPRALPPGRERQPAPALPDRRTRYVASSTWARRPSSCTRSTAASAATTRALYPAYQVLAERGVPLVVHCGTSTFPGSMNELADPAYLLPVVRDFPTLDVVLAHGGRGWWYDAAAFMALLNPTVWIELSGLPPKRLPDYYRRFDLGRLARRWIFATDWPGVPGTAENARAVVGLGLADDVAAAVLGGNAVRVYAGLNPQEDP